MFAFNKNTSSNAALQVDLKNSQGVNNELLVKIIALQTERQLARERELALLELLDSYRKEALERASAPAEEIAIPEITTIKSSGVPLSSAGSSPRLWSSPVRSELAIEEEYIIEGLEALKTLLTLSATPRALSLFRTTSQTEAYQVSATNLGHISDLATRFAADVATLRGRCVRSQDELVPGVLEPFMADATSTLNQFMDPSQPNPEHPMELTFRFHGLVKILQMLCQQSRCPGFQTSACFHTLSPMINGCLAVTLVHPGGSWKGLQRCLFAGLSGATMLEGDIFNLVGMASIHESNREALDDASWAAVFQDTDVVDVFWILPGDCDYVHDDHLEETDPSPENTSSEVSLTSRASSNAPSISEVPEQAEETLARLEIADEGPVAEPEALEQAEAASAELGTYSQRSGGHRYLRAGEGANSSPRSSSLISVKEDLRYDSPEPPKDPYTFLKRGDGLRRRSGLSSNLSIGKKEVNV